MEMGTLHATRQTSHEITLRCAAGGGMSQMSRVLFSSASEHWETPKDLYAALDEEFNFDLDPCSLHSETDGLSLSWDRRRVYCNPPYGPKIGAWLAKAREAEISVFLLPSRTDTKWWHEYAMKADEIRFLKGRLKFNGSKTGAPFPSVLLIYRGKP